MCDDTITVFNAKLDDDTGYDVYTGTVITGVSWYCEVDSSVDKDGLKAANKFVVRVPTDASFSDKTYLDPVTYAKSGNPANNFTFQSGDIIVKGSVSIQNPTPSLLQKTYSDVVTVLGLTDNRKVVHAPHWKLVGS